MDMFIELTYKDENSKVLCPIKNINRIEQIESGKAFVAMGRDKKGNSIGFKTVESYEDIKSKLNGNKEIL